MEDQGIYSESDMIEPRITKWRAVVMLLLLRGLDSLGLIPSKKVR